MALSAEAEGDLLFIYYKPEQNTLGAACRIKACLRIFHHPCHQVTGMS
jgi:hypothetical protein